MKAEIAVVLISEGRLCPLPFRWKEIRQ